MGIMLTCMELWHIMNRGVDGKVLFPEEGDCIRFVHDLYEFNNETPANNTSLQLEKGNNDLRSRYSGERLVDIHGWVLNRDHYHLLLSERVEGGQRLFLRKLNIGFAKYFNEKYNRHGTLFQGRTKRVLVSQHAHFLHILHYIHLNPLDYLEGSEGWRLRDKGNVRSVRTALEYLDTYRWSSYLDYCGKRNFPSILTTSLFKNKDVFEDYRSAVGQYLNEIELDELSGLSLE